MDTPPIHAAKKKNSIACKRDREMGRDGGGEKEECVVRYKHNDTTRKNCKYGQKEAVKSN